MSSITSLQFLPLTFADWVNRRQQLVIEYLLEESRVLREPLGQRRSQWRLRHWSFAWLARIPARDARAFEM